MSQMIISNPMKCNVLHIPNARLNDFETNKIKIDTVIILQSKITQCHIIYIPLYYYWWIAWRGENFCTSRLWKCIWSCITMFKSFRTMRISLCQADDVCDRTFTSLHYLLYKKLEQVTTSESNEDLLSWNFY